MVYVKNFFCLFCIIPQENGILIESIDACFGLARKKAKGGNTISSRHGDLLFSDQDDVDNLVDNYTHCGQKSMDQVYCVTFFAVNNEEETMFGLELIFCTST